jgi:CshA-type fibril repeat protein
VTLNGNLCGQPLGFLDAVNDINQVPAGSTVTGNVLTNDETTGLTVQSATYYNASGVVTPLQLGTATPIYTAAGVLAGTMTLNADGSYTFASSSTFSGDVPVNYTAVNAEGSTDTATLEIKVIPVVSAGNDNPIAQNDTATTEAGVSVTSNALANDSDPDGNLLTITAATQGATTLVVNGSTPNTVTGVDSAGNPVANAGTLVLNPNGTYTFVPAAGFTGTIDPVTYTISDGNGGTDTAVINISVYPNSGNNVFANDDANSGPKGSTMNGNVLTNDFDPEANTQTVSSASANGTAITIGTATVIPGVGTLTLNANGSYTFVPLATFVGTLNVPYTVCDNGTPQACDSATLYLTSLATPMLDAQNDINQVPSGTTATGSVLTNDSVSDNSAITVTSATYLNASGVATPLPLGTATQVYDASGTLAGTMTLNSNGTYTFVPAANYSGTVPVNYTAANSSGSTDTATLSIEVIPAITAGNDKPIAQNDTASTEVGTNVSSTVLANDSDPDGNPLTVSAASVTLGTPTQVSGVDANGNVVANAGSLTLNSNGTYTFVPAPGFTGYVNPVSYTVSDGNGGTDTATLTITVLPNIGNDTFANDDANIAPKGSTMTGNIITNDSDPEANTQTVSSASANGTAITIGTATVIPGVGTLTLNANGSYTFVPLATFVGTLNVPYTVCDNGTPQACDSATLYLTALPSLSLSVCYETPTDLTTSVPVNHGITVLKRAGIHTGITTANDWPMVRNSAYTALESKTKGFVITRNASPETTIANPVVGMMVFDTDAPGVNGATGCLKIYTGSGASEGWKCFNTQGCP